MPVLYTIYKGLDIFIQLRIIAYNPKNFYSIFEKNIVFCGSFV